MLTKPIIFSLFFPFMSLPSATYLSKKTPAFPLVNPPELLVPPFHNPPKLLIESTKYPLQNILYKIISTHS